MSAPRLSWAACLLCLVACGSDDVRPTADEATGDGVGSDVDVDVENEASADDVGAEVMTDAGPDASADTMTDADSGAAVDDVADALGPLDDDLFPCDALDEWPFSIASSRRPIRVHFRERSDRGMAEDAMKELEYAWEAEVDGLGFREPLSDDGACGPDANFDVFLWKGYEECYVDLVTDAPETPIDDGPAFMVLDPWGPYGGEFLDATVAHELNHACQAAYDWNEAAFIYEATSTYMEDVIHDDDDEYLEILRDFQFHTDWSLDRDDGYETWYMYGAGLWLHFLHERFFPEDPGFIADLWEGLASAPRANEPDVADSVDALLAPFGSSYVSSVVEFARWRWYVGARDDGRHLSEAALFPEDASPRVMETLPASGGEADIAPMMLGTVYVDVIAEAGETEFGLGLETEVDVDFVVQLLPSPDGEVVTLPARVALLEEDGVMRRTVAITAVPRDASRADPDLRTDTRHDAVLKVGP